MADERHGASSATDIEVTLAREALLGQLVTFTRSLRDRGAAVPPDATLTGARALATVGLDDRDQVRIALRAALVSRREDLELFDRLFPTFWQRVVGDATSDAEPPAALDENVLVPDPDTIADDELEHDVEPTEEVLALESRLEPAGPDDEHRADPGDEEEPTAVYSPSGRSERVEATPGLAGATADLAEPIRELTGALATLRGRRWTLEGRTRPDVRRALRRSVETGGAPLEIPGQQRRPAAVRAVLLVDVSRSVLDTIDRGFLISFVRAVRSAWRDVAVFFFDTSVREVTEAFDAPTTADALVALEAAEAAWGGGTRIGQAVGTLRREHPTRVDRDTVVFVISDGLEVGEIDILEREMAWLSRRAAAVLWANPLAAAEAYEPTCRGMAAALPYLDGLFAFTDADDVAEMARQLARHGPGDRVGYEFDARERV